MSEVVTYPEMDAQIVGLLRIRSDDPTCGYAAARIVALEAEVRTLRERAEAAERERDDAMARLAEVVQALKDAVPDALASERLAEWVKHVVRERDEWRRHWEDVLELSCYWGRRAELLRISSLPSSPRATTLTVPSSTAQAPSEGLALVREEANDA